MPRVTPDEKQWLSTNQPGLICLERPKYSLVEGKLHVHGQFNDVELEDAYQVRLELNADDGRPNIWETAGRLENIRKARSLERVEMHMNGETPNGTLCLAAPQEIKLKYLPSPSVVHLFNRYILPHFYSQSFFEQFKDWPWRHLPHNAAGILTWFDENSSVPHAAHETVAELTKLAPKDRTAQRIISSAGNYDSFSPRNKCLCGSGRSYEACHRSLWRLALVLRHADASLVRSL